MIKQRSVFSASKSSSGCVIDLGVKNMEMHKVWLSKCAHLLIKVYYLYNNLIIMKLKIYLICFWKQSN